MRLDRNGLQALPGRQVDGAATADRAVLVVLGPGTGGASGRPRGLQRVWAARVLQGAFRGCGPPSEGRFEDRWGLRKTWSSSQSWGTKPFSDMSPSLSSALNEARWVQIRSPQSAVSFGPKQKKSHLKDSGLLTSYCGQGIWSQCTLGKSACFLKKMFLLIF